MFECAQPFGEFFLLLISFLFPNYCPDQKGFLKPLTDIDMLVSWHLSQSLFPTTHTSSILFLLPWSEQILASIDWCINILVSWRSSQSFFLTTHTSSILLLLLWLEEVLPIIDRCINILPSWHSSHHFFFTVHIFPCDWPDHQKFSKILIEI